MRGAEVPQLVEGHRRATEGLSYRTPVVRQAALAEPLAAPRREHPRDVEARGRLDERLSRGRRENDAPRAVVLGKLELSRAVDVVTNRDLVLMHIESLKSEQLTWSETNVCGEHDHRPEGCAVVA